MTHAIRIHAYGGPDAMKWEQVEVPPPGSGQVLVRNSAIGLNYIDTYHRTGLYPLPLPAIIGSEGAGVIEAVGPDVGDLHVGDRVAYADPLGAYAESVLRPADRLVKLPDDISERTAAAIMLKGMTAEYLLHRTYKVEPGDIVLIHAAAGGVGQLLCRWAKHLGARVIGTVGHPAKKPLAEAAGCELVITLQEEDLVAKVRAFAPRGVTVVYDGVGAATFDRSLDCLKPRGLMVSFGNASGPVPPFSILTLSTKGSLYLTRPTLFTYISDPADLQNSAQSLFAALRAGIFDQSLPNQYALHDAAQAHRDLEGRKLTGSTILLP